MLTRRSFSVLLSTAPAFAQAPPAASEEITWHDARQFNLEGKAFAETAAPYDRLPAKAEGVVRKEVWNLSRNSAGMCVRFVANTPAIHARWTVTSSRLALPHMAATAVSGLDLYAKADDGRWRWLAVGRPEKFPTNSGPLVTEIVAAEREYMLYLPLYNSVSSVEIGVPAGARIRKAAARESSRKPLVFYGTSITHGASATRAGMHHVAILGRWFDREVVNLGFSGNGKMEPEVTKLVAEIDASVYIFDCLPNMSAEEVKERAEPAVRIIREARPKAPILLVEDRFYQDGFLKPARREKNEANHAALRAAFENLKAAKVPELYYLEAKDLLGDDGEGTVDSSHPTDLGFMRQAEQFQKALKKILS